MMLLMVMSNLAVTHAPSGLVHATVRRAEQLSPRIRRITLGGGDLDRFVYQGFDQWVRLAIPAHEGTEFDRLSPTFDMKGYLRYLTLPRSTRPVIRNYTIRQARTDPPEVDIDFVVHGDEGVAGPWAASTRAGDEVALIDQGCGWRPSKAAQQPDWFLIVADESGLPAAAGVLRDLPRDAEGQALIELVDPADRQDTDAPGGVTVHWLTLAPNGAPGSAALPALHDLDFPAGTPYAFAVGEQSLAVGARRHLVNGRGVGKGNVTFSGYWRRGKSH
jgi:NADPH-dependent ferric siderophore reductase